ncbi:MAG: biopolymer transporter ExbD [candidate division WOR-3 bacterium]
MRRKRIKPGPQREGLILTSLVDIALSLVIGFIVALPFFFETGIFVSTPGVTKGAGAEASDIKANIHLKQDGGILLNEEQVSLEKLEELLPQLLARSLEKKVIVSAEKGIRYERVVTILDMAKRLGAGQLCLLKAK